MEISVVEVTPQYARELLERNTSNRPLTKNRVQTFEEHLRRGSLMLTHQGIAVSESGRLLDGQHRLHAIVNTGISAVMTVATGMQEETFMVLDTGAKRTAGDILKISGGQNTNITASAIRLYLFYVDAPHVAWVGLTKSKLGSTVQIVKEYKSNPENWHWAATTANAHALRRIVTGGPIACLLYMATIHAGFSRDYVEAFVAKLRQGENLQMGDPILAYRNRSITMNDRTRSAQERLADYIKLFNAYSTGQRLKIFKAQQCPPMPSLINASECVNL